MFRVFYKFVPIETPSPLECFFHSVDSHNAFQLMCGLLSHGFLGVYDERMTFDICCKNKTLSNHVSFDGQVENLDREIFLHKEYRSVQGLEKTEAKY